MPFVKEDPRINRQGRIDKQKKPTNREMKERELLLLLRKLKPHVADSILTAAKLMKDTKTSETNKLKAAVIILDNYRKLTLDLYADGVEEDGEAEEVQTQQDTPVFSLKVIDNPDKV